MTFSTQSIEQRKKLASLAFKKIVSAQETLDAILDQDRTLDFDVTSAHNFLTNAKDKLKPWVLESYIE